MRLPRIPLALLALSGCSAKVTGALPGDDTSAAPALTVSGLEPGSGPASGGTSVRVSGTLFTEASTATVGGAPCASLTWISPEELLCVTPPGSPGEVQLAVTDGAATAIAPFTYLASGDTGDSGGDSGETGDSGGDTGETGGDSGETGDSGGDSGDSGGDTGPTVAVGYCHLQWPCSMTAAASTSSATVYGWVYQAGVTDSVGAGAGMTVEVGVGPDGSNPATNGGWSWSAMTYNADKDGLSSGDHANDEYMGAFTTPAASGSYDYCVRVSADAGRSWTYCDGGGTDCPGNGSDDGYSAADAGGLSVK